MGKSEYLTFESVVRMGRMDGVRSKPSPTLTSSKSWTRPYCNAYLNGSRVRGRLELEKVGRFV